MSDSVEYMKNQARLALEKGDKQSSAVLTLCAGFLETVEEADSLRHQLAETSRKLEEARKDDCAWTDYGDDNMPGTYEGKCGIVWTFTEGGIADNDCIYCPRCGGKIIDQAIEQCKGGDDE